jgi:uncharacterized membrane protein
MNETTGVHAPRRTGVLLWSSICLNLLLLGLIGGWWLSTFSDRGGRDAHRPPSVTRADPGFSRGFLAALDPDARREARRELVATWRGLTEERTAVQNARSGIAAALEAEPFDAARLVTAIEGYRDADRALRRAAEAPLIARIGALGSDERRALAALMKRSRPGPGPRSEPAEPLDSVPPRDPELGTPPG